MRTGLRDMQGFQFIGVSQFGVVTDGAGLAVVSSVFVVLGAWSCSRIQV